MVSYVGNWFYIEEKDLMGNLKCSLVAMMISEDPEASVKHYFYRLLPRQELASQRVHETECIFKIEDTDLKNEGVDVIGADAVLSASASPCPQVCCLILQRCPLSAGLGLHYLHAFSRRALRPQCWHAVVWLVNVHSGNMGFGNPRLKELMMMFSISLSTRRKADVALACN
ncbi:unnamed protein product [Enterobius vermicularis]|uniref:Lipocln_cytosolic_FA-bd_dom domain-containing protein n=1 Tax=Enterobius vermicularis TaxID=51028 RepID=A0A0N4V512_ENTVE|nr:unnamed protein product [Enterobius vermicularis]